MIPSACDQIERHKGGTMKYAIKILGLGACLIAGTAAANDDVKWVNKCIADSAGIKGTMQQKTMYCSCMVGKMDDNETRSVTQWEKANPAAMKDCEKRSGWE
jgi:hypothetical protein